MICKRTSFTSDSMLTNSLPPDKLRQILGLESDLSRFAQEYSIPSPDPTVGWRTIRESVISEIQSAFVRATSLDPSTAVARPFVPETEKIRTFLKAALLAHRLESSIWSLQILQGQPPSYQVRLKFYAKNSRQEFLYCFVTYSMPGFIYEFGMHFKGKVGDQIAS
jgi:hypothetical protein